MGRAGTRVLEIEGAPLRWGSGLLLAGAALIPLLPAHEGIICPLRITTGIPCPFCGMTTSIGAVGRGRLVDSAAANPAGLIALATAVAILLMRPQIVRVPLLPLLGALAGMWLFQLARFSIL